MSCVCTYRSGPNSGTRRRAARLCWLATLLFACLYHPAATGAESTGAGTFPPALSSYSSPAGASLFQELAARLSSEPFNLIATLIFFLAIVHTFMAPIFSRLSRRFQEENEYRRSQLREPGFADELEAASFKAELFHFLGEIEAVFGIWVIPLMLTMAISKGWLVARDYIGEGLNFTEPVFVMVIMTIAASRPILKLAEQFLALAARAGKGSAAAWWFSILTLGPLLGSFITEPAAMTICALLLADKFYARRPPPVLAYATLGLLFVNVSVGGTLTHFAAPPVLMVAAKWGWGLGHMIWHLGWKAALGILISNGIILAAFRRQFAGLQAEPDLAGGADPGASAQRAIPMWITGVHVLFLIWTVVNNHFPALFLGGFLFYLAFTEATERHQDEPRLRPALLVGFFLAGLVVHGGLQGWWIQPVLSRLNANALFFGAAVLTAFNDNAAITYLASLVPDFSDTLKYAVLAGAVAGGGLTVIANAPNPAGQSILARFFPEGISPIRLFLGALIPTAITSLVFLLL